MFVLIQTKTESRRESEIVVTESDYNVATKVMREENRQEECNLLLLYVENFKIRRIFDHLIPHLTM